MITLFFEVLVHMGLAVIFTGWNSGFQITLLGMNIIAFYGEYLAGTMSWRRPPAVILSAVTMVEYIGLFIYSSSHSALYPLPERVSFWLQILWAVIVFVIGSACLSYFVHVTTHSERALANEAVTDKLTGLYNRAGYDAFLSGIHVQSVALLLIDSDHFKNINDTYGHETGDRILKKIATLMTAMFRAEDHICRIGGDEFSILMNMTRDIPKDTIRMKISGINHELLNPMDGLPPASISVGVSFGKNCRNVRELFTSADQALYRVKAAGGGDCAFSEGPRQH